MALTVQINSPQTGAPLNLSGGVLNSTGYVDPSANAAMRAWINDRGNIINGLQVPATAPFNWAFRWNNPPTGYPVFLVVEGSDTSGTLGPGVHMVKVTCNVLAPVKPCDGGEHPEAI